ncbi:MFS transporter [Zeimonas arvi]|uniref:MFS transporter n=1 Tax=Zeimonas arvi TaxID=2498847 RepID=A0A5C8P5K1_9BURK|nr:MFS transporter [Zeimonas arvi]TXL68588.1 MFS transporter [Zeimonas arvi]
MKGFYGWRMVIAGSALQFLQGGLMMQAFGAYVAVLTTERGWSKTALSGAAALQSVESALIGPALGWLVDRVGEHRLIQLGIVIFGLGLIAMGSVDTLAGFYGAVLLVALGSSLAGYFTINIALIHWFERQRARALSSAGLGLALGGLFVPVVAASITAFGWRATAIGSGVLAIAIGWPLARVFRGRPDALGMRIDGASAQTAAATDAPAPTHTDVTPGLTARQALRTGAFWLLSAGHGIALFAVTSVNVHAITHIKEGLGYSVAQASLVITLMTGAQIGGVLLGMAAGDRYDKRWICAACMLGHGFGLLMLTYANGSVMLAAFALLHGTAWGLRGPLMQAIRADYFGRRSIGMIMGLSSVVIAVGQVGGPLVAGAFADLTGDYRLGYTLLAVLALGGSFAFLLARPPALPGVPAAR